MRLTELCVDVVRRRECVRDAGSIAKSSRLDWIAGAPFLLAGAHSQDQGRFGAGSNDRVRRLTAAARNSPLVAT